VADRSTGTVGAIIFKDSDPGKPARVPVQTAIGMPILITESQSRRRTRSVLLRYDSMNTSFRFGDQLVIESNTPGELFADGGDSGSLVVTEAGETVGIVFAGSDAQTIASPLKDPVRYAGTLVRADVR